MSKIKFRYRYRYYAKSNDYGAVFCKRWAAENYIAKMVHVYPEQTFEIEVLRDKLYA